MDGRDEDGVRRFVEHLAMLFADWGFPRMAARVLLVLMTAEEPGLNAAQLAERLAASPAAISGAVRYLGQLGLVVREAVPGERADRYRLPDDAWYTATAAETKLYDTIVEAATGAVPALGGPDTPAGGRVAEMAEFFAFMRAEMAGLLTRWKESRTH